MLCHQKLGYIKEKGLRVLYYNGMVEGMSNFSLDFDFCEHFLYGKHNWVRFFSIPMTSEGTLELVHNDEFGLVLVPSLGKFVYYVPFIDDFSRNTWIYFLRKKYKVFNKFKDFKALMENQIKNKFKVLRIY